MALSSYFEWAWGGVDVTMDAIGGDECIHFVPTQQKIVESAVFIPIALFQIYWGWKNLPIIKTTTKKASSNDDHADEKSGGDAINNNSIQSGPRNAILRCVLLIALVFTFGMEVGFKLASRTMVWIVNPCHVITLLQIVLLSLPPGMTSTHLLRCLTNSINGPLVALLFPAIDTRLLYFERTTYFLQHWLIVLIPWLLTVVDGDSYPLELLWDWSYAVFSMGLMFLYHWIPLQLCSIWWGFNLNVICCPSVDDPFYGPNYRIACFTHQTIMCLFTAKIVRICAVCFLGLFPGVGAGDINQSVKTKHE